MSQYSEEEIQQIYTTALFDLGKLAGALSVPEVRAKMLDAIQESPENDRMFAYLCRLNAELDILVEAGTVKRHDKRDEVKGG